MEVGERGGSGDGDADGPAAIVVQNSSFFTIDGITGTSI